MISYLKKIVDLTPYLNTPPLEGVRFNRKKIGREEFLKTVPFGVEPSPFYADGFYIEEETSGNHPYHHAGMYYFQEPSAMSAVTALQLEGEERVLDLCAAPGSKATAIGSALTKGLLVANEIKPNRASVLAENMERMGISRAVVTNSDAAALAKAFPAYFDKILIDSPCSGEGMFRKYPRILEEWTEDLVEMCAARSRELLEQAAGMLRPGGRLVYSTCTFNLEENERTILWFLERHPDFETVETGIQGGSPALLGLSNGVRIFPANGGEGHFVCALRHKGEGSAAAAPTFPKEKHPDALAALQELLKIPLEGNLIQRGERYFLVDPDLPCPKGVRILRAGMEVLEQKEKQWKPAHHLAMCLPKEAFYYHEELTLPQAEAYLRGETVPCNQKGYGVVTTAGIPLGWIKASQGIGKNHYPKGLRLLK